ncbi:MAG: phosphoribosylglycinamide formyltransferase [Desulfohalobiaceae bacterium]|nr:phosphoribosylglycinamide formyltransferase [Desulfohalobiaceae bacterium]
MTLPLAILASGSGTNLESIARRIEEGALDARIRLVLSNRPGARGVERAEAMGLPVRVEDHTAYSDRASHEAAVIAAIREHGAEAVVLAGYMRLVSRDFVQAFSGKVLNIHPSLLPAFRGAHAQRDAAEYGVRISGATVHFVDEHMDHGPVIIQAAVPAVPEDNGDSLAGHILALEHRIYPQAVQWLSQGRLHVRQGRVFLDEAPSPEIKESSGGPGLISPGLEPRF